MWKIEFSASDPRLLKNETTTCLTQEQRHQSLEHQTRPRKRLSKAPFGANSGDAIVWELDALSAMLKNLQNILPHTGWFDSQENSRIRASEFRVRSINEPRMMKKELQPVASSSGNQPQLGRGITTRINREYQSNHDPRSNTVEYEEKPSVTVP